MKGKSRRSGGTVQLDYLIHIQELKPWPPSQSLKSIRSVLIQWENGERSSGSTKPVSPSNGGGKMEFNESFRLSVTLVKDMSVKSSDAEVFQKNTLEFNLYEPRRDKIVKGQLLGTAIVDLADCGMLRETLSISVPLNCKRNYRNTDQPLLFVKIEPVEKNRNKPTLKDSLLKENCSSGDSVSALMNGEYAEEAENTSITDDDVSSHSSVAAVINSPESSAYIPPDREENGTAQKNGRKDKEHHLVSETIEKLNMMQQDMHVRPKRSSINGHNSMENIPSHGLETTQKQVVSPSADYSSISLEEKSMSSSRSSDQETLDQEIHEKAANDINVITNVQTNNNEGSLDSNGFMNKNPGSVNCDGLEIKDKLNERCEESDKYCVKEGGSDEYYYSSVEDRLGKSERSKYIKSVRSSGDLARSIGSLGSNYHAEVKENGINGDAQNNGGIIRSSERKDSKIYPKDARNSISGSKIEQLENKIKMLEGELREAASIEAALYSVAAEHGSSMSKVHAPARRLSRLYLHACKENIPARRSGAAKSAVSGLVLVAKACGNDVPRLTFWLSNAIVLRTIISQTRKDVAPSNPSGTGARRKSGEGNGKIVQPLIWKGFSPKKTENIEVEYGGFVNWDDSNVFTSALEKVETWIFSRIVESIWWQSLTPHMQLVDAKITHKDVGSASSKSFTKTLSSSSSHDQEMGNLSLDIWKKAFREACERICPVRAGGHECGCLSVLPRLIMEQCIARLDVAMFNAILRESVDDIPSDPISDPISDPKVLPIPPGKSSFGAGAQLKTAVGNWSRWLTDLFGMDDDDSLKDKDNDDIDNNDGNASFKAFHLLNALSDLLMLPKDMLLSASIRKEVCPMFGASIIKTIVENFVPDEFCPDPIPTDVFEALDLQDDVEDEEESVKNFPCIASPIVYSPPQATTIAKIIGEIGSESQHSQLRRSRSSVIRKSHTSDDELDELNSPLSSILFSNSSRPVSTKPNLKWKESRNESSTRYALLRNVWMNSE
ncbi:EEIG1/EHBP1 protein amino-terminal domain protein [Trifolium repens]|nr:EEIG1/EHBP1 protein amino-terminal domain protein [Trifolium repens]